MNESCEVAQPEAEVGARQYRRQLAGLFLVLSALYGLTTGGHMYSIDDELKYVTTEALIRGDATIEFEYPFFAQLYHERPDGEYASVYSLGQSVVALPFYAAGRILALGASDASADLTVRTTTLLTNSVMGALVAVFLALLCRELGASRRHSILLAIVYAVGTFAFPMMKTFGAEPGAAMLITAACWLAFRARRAGSARTVLWCGVAVASASHFRISALSFIPLVLLYLVLSARSRAPSDRLREVAYFAMGVAIPVGLLLLSNWWRYSSPFDVGYNPINTNYSLVKGMLNIYFSPGKSFFLYAPIAAVVVAALVARWRSFDLRLGLLVAIVALNTFTISRLASWNGGQAWGPRLTQIVLPLVVAMAAPVIGNDRWRRAVKVAGIAGFAGPAMLGVLINFDVFYVDAQNALGGEPVPSEPDQLSFHVAMHHDLAWNPMLGHLELVPRAIRDAFGELRVGEEPRSAYSPDLGGRYNFFTQNPRLDFWWLWVRPAGGSALTYLLLVPVLGSGILGTCLLWNRRIRKA